MNKVALIVVDMQNDFLCGSLALKDCPAHEDAECIIDTVNELSNMTEWDLVVFTKDWHPCDHISFVTNAHKYEQHHESQVITTAAEVYDAVAFNIDGSKQEQVMWPPHCIQGSWGSELHPQLKEFPKGVLWNFSRVPSFKVNDSSHIICKGESLTVDSYSAFFDNNKMRETRLRVLLHDHKITHTFICGVATDVCVNFTAFDSHECGFKTCVITDACAGVNQENIDATLKKMQNAGIRCFSSDQVSTELSKVKAPPSDKVTTSDLAQNSAGDSLPSSGDEDTAL